MVVEKRKRAKVGPCVPVVIERYQLLQLLGLDHEEVAESLRYDPVPQSRAAAATASAPLSRHITGATWVRTVQQYSTVTRRG